MIKTTAMTMTERPLIDWCKEKKDGKFHSHKHSIAKNHSAVDLCDFKVLGKNKRKSSSKRKITEKTFKPQSLNKQETNIN